ncbi:MAG: 50S ribosomal protein L3 [bacterium]|nr:50S ribosomal protein L3 [bacterium]
MPGLIGKKVGMTRVIQEDGAVVPVTVISVPDAIVVQVKTVDKDGYEAVVLGIEPLKKPTKTKKFRILKEFRVNEMPEKGATINLNLLGEAGTVSISSVSKGHGFTGVIKRHNFSGFPGGHGHSSKNNGGTRKGGSMGCRSKPGKIKKGKKQAGRHGFDLQTRHKVPVVRLDLENKLLAVKGPVPGAPNTTVYIRF